jgi:trimeric autotransporter adhesin
LSALLCTNTFTNKLKRHFVSNSSNGQIFFMKLFFLSLLIVFSVQLIQAQNVAINNNGILPNASAMLDVSSNTKGVLIPRMTKLQRNAIASPAKGLLVFVNDTDSVGFHYYDGSNWLWLEALGKAGWKTTGNINTDTAINFLGTTNNMPLRFKLNNTWAGQWDIEKENYFIGKNVGKTNTTGINNVGIGASVLNNNKEGSRNIALGDSVMHNHIKGSQNIALGANALQNSDSSFFQIAIGENALQSFKNNYTSLGSNSIWNQNIAIGQAALSKAVNGGINYAIGAGALQSFNYNGAGYNVALGFNAQASNEIGLYNTSIGHNSMAYFRKGNSNTAIGGGAMLISDSCNSNTALGALALATNKTGNNNIAIGENAANGLDSASNNIAIGRFTLSDNTYGNYNIALGDSSGYYSNKGDYNIFIGKKAGFYTNTGNENTLIGSNAGAQVVLGNANTYVGTNVNGKPFAGIPNNNTGYANVAMGSNAFYNNKEGFENVVIGILAANANTSGDNNVAIGSYAAYSNTTANKNIAIGASSLVTNQTGENNIAMGYFSLYGNKASDKIAIGHYALQNDTSNFPFHPNLAFGNSSFSSLKKGEDNLAIGQSAGLNIANGTRNILIGNGAYALGNLVTDSTADNVIIGTNAMYTSRRSNQNTVIGTYSNFSATDSAFANTMLGAYASSATSAQFNTLVGWGTKSAGIPRLINASAIGAFAFVDTSNALVLGSVIGVNTATANTNIGIGTSKPKAALHLSRGAAGNASIIGSNRTLLIEDNSSSYIQLLHPNNSESGILSGNANTLIKSGIIFTIDSSIQLRTGGGLNRLIIDNTGNTGINTITPKSILEVNGAIASPINLISANFSATNLHSTLIINATAAITVTLPAASSCARRQYVIVNQDAFTHVISSYRDFTNSANAVVPAIASITLQSDGLNWYRIN